MFEKLKQAVYEANMELHRRRNLVLYTWGNVSQADRKAGVFAIKPSGVPYETLKAEDIVVLSLSDGKKVDGILNPSSDTPTHYKLYLAFPDVNGITHTHSTCATSWAQAGKSIPCLGTTHADYMNGEIPVTRYLSPKEVDSGYEAETATVIAEAFAGKDPLHTPAVLVGKEGYIKNLYISGIGKAYADGTKYYSTFYAGKVKTNTDSNVNLRAGAGSSEAKIMTLKKGINVTVLGKNGDWYLIATADGTQGFISTSLVTTSASGSGSGSGSGGSGSASKDTAKVTGTRVYMRSGPSTSYAPITLLKQGTTVKVVSTANPKWWKISYGSLTGYMWSQYLKRQ